VIACRTRVAEVCGSGLRPSLPMNRRSARLEAEPPSCRASKTARTYSHLLPVTSVTTNAPDALTREGSAVAGTRCTCRQLPARSLRASSGDRTVVILAGVGKRRSTIGLALGRDRRASDEVANFLKPGLGFGDRSVRRIPGWCVSSHSM